MFKTNLDNVFVSDFSLNCENYLLYLSYSSRNDESQSKGFKNSPLTANEPKLHLTLIPQKCLHSLKIPISTYHYVSNTTIPQLQSKSSLKSINLELYRNYILNGLNQQDHTGGRYEYELEEQINTKSSYFNLEPSLAAKSSSILSDDFNLMSDLTSKRNNKQNIQLPPSQILKLFKLMGTTTRVPVQIAEFELECRLDYDDFNGFVNRLQTEHKFAVRRIAEYETQANEQKEKLNMLQNIRNCLNTSCSVKLTKQHLLEQMCLILNSYKIEIANQRKINDQLIDEINKIKKPIATEESPSSSPSDDDMTEENLNDAKSVKVPHLECAGSNAMIAADNHQIDQPDVENAEMNQNNQFSFSVHPTSKLNDLITRNPQDLCTVPMGVDKSSDIFSTSSNTGNRIEFNNFNQVLNVDLPMLELDLPSLNIESQIPYGIVRKRVRFQPWNSVNENPSTIAPNNGSRVTVPFFDRSETDVAESVNVSVQSQRFTDRTLSRQLYVNNNDNENRQQVAASAFLRDLQ